MKLKWEWRMQDFAKLKKNLILINYVIKSLLYSCVPNTSASTIKFSFISAQYLMLFKEFSTCNDYFASVYWT